MYICSVVMLILFSNGDDYERLCPRLRSSSILWPHQRKSLQLKMAVFDCNYCWSFIRSLSESSFVVVVLAKIAWHLCGHIDLLHHNGNLWPFILEEIRASAKYWHNTLSKLIHLWQIMYVIICVINLGFCVTPVSQTPDIYDIVDRHNSLKYAILLRSWPYLYYHETTENISK